MYIQVRVLTCLYIQLEHFDIRSTHNLPEKESILYACLLYSVFLLLLLILLYYISSLLLVYTSGLQLCTDPAWEAIRSA